MSKQGPLKVAYIAPDFDEKAASGGLYVIFEHCNALIAKGHHVRVFNDYGKKSRYLKLDCSVERHHYDTSAIDSWKPDIAVATHWRTFYFVQRLDSPVSCGTKLFYLIQSDERYVVNESLTPFYLRTITGKGAAGEPFRKIAVSRYLQKMLKSDFGEDSVYIPNGIRVKDVPPLLERSERVRVIARYDPSKFRGWGMVDSALKKLSVQRPDVEIHLFEMKKKKPTEYKSAIHIGQTGDSMLGLFRSCDIFLAANEKEGFSYPVLEAMSQGSCVCCTDAGGNMDFCIDDKTALVAPAHDNTKLYNNLMRLVDDAALRKEISDNGIAKAHEFNWDSSTGMLERAFISAASEKAPARQAHDAVPRRQGHILMIWEKDPFTDQAEWMEFDGAIRRAWQESSRLDVIVMADRHPMKSARSFLDMLLPKEMAASVDTVVLYHKKFPVLPKGVALSLFRGAVRVKAAIRAIKGARYSSVLRYPDDKPKIA
jgi:glycosyltransferase involved in cell wall biosynthesis